MRPDAIRVERGPGRLVSRRNSPQACWDAGPSSLLPRPQSARPIDGMGDDLGAVVAVGRRGIRTQPHAPEITSMGQFRRWFPKTGGPGHELGDPEGGNEAGHGDHGGPVPARAEPSTP